MKQIFLILTLINTLNIFSQDLSDTLHLLNDNSTIELDLDPNNINLMLDPPEMSADFSIADSVNLDSISSVVLTDINYPDGLKSGSGNGDNSSGDKLVIFPSPTAASLINLQNNDVSLYTGTVSQSIPLNNFQSYDINVPITLNYSSTGVKVNEIASWVGLGWNLKAGGQITRVMKGLPDEFQGTVIINEFEINAFGFNKFMEKLSNEGKDPLTYLEPSSFFGLEHMDQIELLQNSSMSGNDYNDVTSDEAWDTQPDEFYFNFGNYSGKFVFTNDGEIITIPKYNFKITYNTDKFAGKDYDLITDFTVITDDGYTYSFGKTDLSGVETTSYSTRTKPYYYYHRSLKDTANKIGILDANHLLWYYLEKFPFLDHENLGWKGESDYHDFTSTWYLTEIKSPMKNTVTFNYWISWPNLTYVQNQGERASITNCPEYQQGVLITPAKTAVKQSLTLQQTTVTHSNMVLESIVGSNGFRIDFTSLANRKDLINGKRLSLISVIDNSGNNIKKYEFKYNDVYKEEPRLVGHRIGYRLLMKIM